MKKYPMFALPLLSRQRNSQRGAALIAALGMLMLFSVLGTAYVSFMSLEQQSSRMALQETRARHLAQGGIYAAVGELQAAIQSGNVPAASYTFQIPLYMPDGDQFAEVPQEVTVQVIDESALINLNHIERELLEAVGIPRSKARDIRNKLPRHEIPSMEKRYWLSSLDSLRTRDFLTAREFQNLDTDILTVFTVADADNAANFININSASSKVLGILFNMTEPEAEVLAAKRPFTSWSDVTTKVGRDPSTYRVHTNPLSNREMPTELALTSRCYRLISSSQMKNNQTTRFGMSSEMETVVLLQDDGSYTFRFWDEAPSERVTFDVASATEELASDEMTTDEEASDIDNEVVENTDDTEVTDPVADTTNETPTDISADTQTAPVPSTSL